MRKVRPRQPTVNVLLVVLVVFGALLVTIMTARAMYVSGHEVPQTCPPPASYAVVSVAHGGATGRNADHHANEPSCTRPSTPILPIPTPSNDFIDDRGCS
ncbi:MAG TPA: hypothetical protein VGS80_18330 [Ktedonobacterales bacterium]|nr:hypothetical protein [Ktedonobacterales bacterium]